MPAFNIYHHEKQILTVLSQAGTSSHEHLLCLRSADHIHDKVAFGSPSFVRLPTGPGASQCTAVFDACIALIAASGVDAIVLQSCITVMLSRVHLVQDNTPGWFAKRHFADAAGQRGKRTHQPS